MSWGGETGHLGILPPPCSFSCRPGPHPAAPAEPGDATRKFEVAQITEHMELVGSDGQHVGTVDRVQGKLVKLTKAESGGGGEHRYVPLSVVQGIHDHNLTLSVPAQQAL